MSQPHKVFISYHRDLHDFIGRVVFHALREQSCDVFMDVTCYGPDRLDLFTQNMIEAHSHFVVILSSSTKSWSSDARDRQHNQLRYAKKVQRRIALLLTHGLRSDQLDDWRRWENLSEEVAPAYEVATDGAGIDQLIEHFNVHEEAHIIKPASAHDRKNTNHKTQVINGLKFPTHKQLEAERLVDQGRMNAYERYFYIHPSDEMGPYKQALDIYPDYAYAHYLCSKFFRPRREYDTSISYVNQAIQLNPYHPDFYRHRASLHRTLSNPSEARTDYDIAIRLDGLNPEHYADRAGFRWGQSDRQGALADFSHAIQLDPTNPEYYERRASRFSLLGDFRNQIADLTSALHFGADRNYHLIAANHVYRGCGYEQLGKFSEANADWEKALGLLYRAPAVFYNRRGYFFLAIDDFDRAIQEFETALSFGESRDARKGIAQARAKRDALNE